MNTLFKLMILLLVAIALIGCGKAGSANTADTASQIADFTLPDGYQAEYGIKLAGYAMASYNNGDGHSHLYLIQAPKDSNADQAKLEEMMGQAETGKKDRTTRMTVVEKRDATIRGKATTLLISEGTNGDGDPYREATAVFDGKGGPALVVIEEPISTWDDAKVEQFIASIK